MRVLSWNMAGRSPGLQATTLHERAWEALLAIQPRPDAALLQEATAPPVGLGNTPSAGGLASDVRADSLIWAPGLELLGGERLEGVREHGYATTARVAVNDRELALISLHAETKLPGAITHVEALLDRLDPWIGRGSFILAGDFNSCRLAHKSWPRHRHLEFFERAEADYRMFDCYWRLHGEERRTFWWRCQDKGTPFQNDHIFTSADLGDAVTSCEVLDYEPFRGISDHAPIVAELDL
jgi:hypothetical protein